MFNGGFWADHFRHVFAMQINYFCDAVETRFLPTFDDLEEEADKVAEEEYDRLYDLADPDYFDDGDIAEQADDAGTDYYLSMEGVRQALLNLSVAALYHLFEQQCILFHRREVLDINERNDVSLIKIKVFEKRLCSAGVNIRDLGAWQQIEELTCTANAIKHAEGKSSEKLRQMRPDLFRHPMAREETEVGSVSMSPVFMPLAGEDIFLTVTDLNKYRKAVLDFWEQLGAAILQEPAGD
jgi:hypothetical protein